MIVYKNKEFRNLQEQVYKNMSDIANLKSSGIVLDEFGIKVVGQESSVANMPTVEDYKENNPDWAYGDAYAIGTEAPYELYILTRVDANHEDDYWFNIGEFPAPGPQGEEGPEGPQGPQGETGNPGANGLSAGFGTPTVSVTTLEPGEDATVSITASGPDTEKVFAFSFGIPEGQPGEDAQPVWGTITGDLDDQTDLVNVLQSKQNTLVSGTNIKTINSESILGSGNIVIQGGGNAVWGQISGTLSDQTDLKNALDSKQDDIDGNNKLPAAYVSGLANVATSGSYNDLTDTPTIPTIPVTDVEVNGTSVLSGTVAEIDLTGYATTSDISDMATQTWVGNQGYLTSVSWSDISSKPTFATVATSGSYTDLTDKPTIPTATSDLNNDSGFITSSDIPVTDVEVNGTSVLSGTVAQVTVPTDTSDLTNTAGYITGITSSDVTTALGYTPANSTSLGDYVTLATDQSISGAKTFTNDVTVGPLKTNNTNNQSKILNLQYYGSTTHNPGNLKTVKALQISSYGGSTARLLLGDDSGSVQTSITGYGHINFLKSPVPSQTVPDTPLGESSYPWTIAWISSLKKGSSSTYSLLVPTTSSWTADKTIATTDQIITSYNDLTDKPTIPAAQVNSDWSANSGVAQILNKPTLVETITVNNVQYSQTGSDITLPDLLLLDDPNHIQNVDGDVKFSGTLNPNSSGYGLVMPTTTSYTANKTIATTDQIPSVPVTDVTVDGVSVVSSGTAAITMPTIPTSLPVETLTTEPSAAYAGPGMKVVYLSAEPTTKYAGYIYMIAES